MKAQIKPVLAVALDAAEPSIVERWIDTGVLPNLRQLRYNGAYGRLKSSAYWLSGSPWPTFYTGTSPAEHGLYETTQWRPELMQNAKATASWLPLKPFWRNLAKDIRVVSVDLPMVYAPEPYNGVEIRGWMTQDSISNIAKPTSYPENLLIQLRKEFGLKPIHIDDKWGVQTVSSLLKLRDQLVEGTLWLAELTKTMMSHQTWDLFLVSFGSPHIGGHKLWDLSGTVGHVGTRKKAEFSEALKNIYIACDKAIGKLVKEAPDEASLLVFSLHGMRANNNRSHYLPKILTQIINPNSTITNNVHGTKVREKLELAFPPHSKADRLFCYCRSKLSHAPKTASSTISPAFCLITDQNGYVRINLRNRERDGVIGPSGEYEKLCSEIIKDLESFVDADSREPIVEQAVRSEEAFKIGSRTGNLPDIIIRWSEKPSAYQRVITSTYYPSFSISLPVRNLDGRSGNHNSEGFLLASGHKVQPNSKIKNGDILDLAATICDLLGLDKPPYMQGNSLLSQR